MNLNRARENVETLLKETNGESLLQTDKARRK